MKDFVLEGLPKDWTPERATIAIASAFHTEGTQKDIATVGLAITHLLLLKNRRYGNSALDPVAIFAPNLTARERMAVRMDDKLSRISRGLGIDGGDGEHPGVDLVGYLILDIIADYYQQEATIVDDDVPPLTTEEEEELLPEDELPPMEAFNND